MRVEYIAHTGSDLMVVDAARVSFDKQTTEDELTEKDIKLINETNTVEEEYKREVNGTLNNDK